MSKVLILCLILSVIFVVSGCENQRDTIIENSDLSNEVTEYNDYIGLTEEEAMILAEVNGVPFRVVERDGEMMAVTMDFRPGRINASVVDGEVVSYEIEG